MCYYLLTMPSGFLLIDKPPGPTSHDIVDQVRRATGEKRVGHAGTLDPFASGLLIVGVGREATKEFEKLVGLPKAYEAVFILGATSETDDVEGPIRPTGKSLPTLDVVKKAATKFVGEIEQLPPRHSAVKVGGQKAYEAARKGQTLELKKRRVTISRFEMREAIVADGLLRLPVSLAVSSGTYIRAIARDLGEALGCGGYVAELRRTSIGPFLVTESVPQKDWGVVRISVEDLLKRV